MGQKIFLLIKSIMKQEISKKLNKIVITVCRSGSRSSIAKSQLSFKGIEVHNGGAWTRLNSLIK